MRSVPVYERIDHKVQVFGETTLIVVYVEVSGRFFIRIHMVVDSFDCIVDIFDTAVAQGRNDGCRIS